VSIEIKQNHRLSPEYVLLGFLYQNPSHGYELHRRLLDGFGNIWHVSQSQTYNILKRLEAQGYITSTFVQQEKLPPRQLLHITEMGLDKFNAWLDQPTMCSVHAIRVEFISKLYFIQQYHPQNIQETISVQSREVQRGLDRLEKMRISIPEAQTFNHLALELRIRLLSSIVSWLDECRGKLSPNLLERDGHV
jgi:DNA-binding PadR family transcriptional regulator